MRKFQKILLNSFLLITLLDQNQVPTIVNIAWDGSYGAGDDIPFEFTFFDENEELHKRYSICSCFL